jgi:hypothetical protein
MSLTQPMQGQIVPVSREKTKDFENQNRRLLVNQTIVYRDRLMV